MDSAPATRARSLLPVSTAPSLHSHETLQPAGRFAAQAAARLVKPEPFPADVAAHVHQDLRHGPALRLLDLRDFGAAGMQPARLRDRLGPSVALPLCRAASPALRCRATQVVVDLRLVGRGLDVFFRDGLGIRIRRVLAGPAELVFVIHEHERGVRRLRVEREALAIGAQPAGVMREEIGAITERILAVVDGVDKARAIHVLRVLPGRFKFLSIVSIFGPGGQAAGFQEEADLWCPLRLPAGTVASEVGECVLPRGVSDLREEQHLLPFTAPDLGLRHGLPFRIGEQDISQIRHRLAKFRKLDGIAGLGRRGRIAGLHQ